MEPTALLKDSGFFTKKFQEDLRSLQQANDSLIQNIRNWLEEIKTAEDYEQDDKWARLSSTTGLTLDDLQCILRPVIFIASRSVENNISLEVIIAELRDANATDDFKTVSNRLRLLGEPLSRLFQNLSDYTSPTLPFLYIENMHTSCIFVSGFEKDIDLQHDDPSMFRPTLKALFPRVSLELSFKDQEEPLGILLSRKELRALRKQLDLAEGQMKAAVEMLKTVKIIDSED